MLLLSTKTWRSLTGIQQQSLKTLIFLVCDSAARVVTFRIIFDGRASESWTCNEVTGITCCVWMNWGSFYRCDYMGEAVNWPFYMLCIWLKNRIILNPYGNCHMGNLCPIHLLLTFPFVVLCPPVSQQVARGQWFNRHNGGGEGLMYTNFNVKSARALSHCTLAPVPPVNCGLHLFTGRAP